MVDRERLDQLVRLYPYLVGLRWVPIGVFYAAMGLVVPYRDRWTEELLLIPLGIACAVAYIGLQVHYTRHFGFVRSLRSRQFRDAAVVLIAAALVTGGSLVESEAVVEPVGIAVAAFLVVLGLQSGLVGRFTWVLVGVLVVVALAPLYTGLSPGSAMAPLMGATVGCALIARGVYEHRHLVTAFRALGQPAHASSGEALR